MKKYNGVIGVSETNAMATVFIALGFDIGEGVNLSLFGIKECPWKF